MFSYCKNTSCSNTIWGSDKSNFHHWGSVNGLYGFKFTIHPNLSAAVSLGSIKPFSHFLISLMSGFSIVIMDLVELTSKTTVSASTVRCLLYMYQLRTAFIWIISYILARRRKKGGGELDNIRFAHCLDMCIIYKGLQCLFYWMPWPPLINHNHGPEVDRGLDQTLSNTLPSPYAFQ